MSIWGVVTDGVDPPFQFYEHWCLKGFTAQITITIHQFLSQKLLLLLLSLNRTNLFMILSILRITNAIGSARYKKQQSHFNDPITALPIHPLAGHITNTLRTQRKNDDNVLCDFSPQHTHTHTQLHSRTFPGTKVVCVHASEQNTFPFLCTAATTKLAAGRTVQLLKASSSSFHPAFPNVRVLELASHETTGSITLLLSPHNP